MPIYALLQSNAALDMIELDMIEKLTESASKITSSTNSKTDTA